MRLAYMAHPLGPDGPEREKNRANATVWFAWLHDAFPSIVFSANWIVLSAGWPETDAHRARELAIDMVHVDACELIFFVGGKLSPEMLEEKSRAANRGLHQVDLTFLGHTPPPITEAPNLAMGLLFRELNNALARVGKRPTERCSLRRPL